MNVSDIHPNPSNPRVIKDGAFEKLVASIREFPKMMALRPIIVDRDGVVLGGNMRLKAIQHIGMKQIPDDWVKNASELTEDEKRRFVISDNVSGGEWNWDDLEQNWDTKKLEEWGLEHEWTTVDLSAEEDDYEIPDDLSTDIVIGDVFEIGDHRLLCGDSADSDQVLKLMDGQKSDMVFTDPPYGVSYVGKTKNALTVSNDDASPEDLKKLVSGWFSCVDIATREGAYLLATVPAGPLHLIFAQDWVDRKWLRQIMVWNKSSMVLGHGEYHYKHEPILFGWKPGGVRLKNTDRTKTTVWDFDKPSASREHPTMKPIKMWEYGIKNHSKPGDLIYEPFMGSGTTMVAAHQLNRKCYGVEVDPKYCQVVIDRMKKLDNTLIIKKNGTTI